jgi:hypothetical protein
MAQQLPAADAVAMRVNGTLRVGPAAAVDTVIGISSDVVVKGMARNVVVINDDGEIAGAVDGDVTAVNGEVRLGPTARVNNVMLNYSGLDRADRATVSGSVRERRN